MPKVSINTITHNRGSLLKEAIESVMSQSFTDWEYIIIDDASTDNTEEIVKSFNDKRIIYEKVEKQPNIPTARNLCLEKSKGKYIAILDSDDIWCDRDKLKKQVEFLDSNPNYILVGTNSVFIDHKGHELYKLNFPEKNKQIKKLILGRCSFSHSNVLFKNNITKYPVNFKTICIEDHHLYLELGKYGKFYNLQSYSSKIRKTKGNITEKFREDQIKQFNYINKLYKNIYPNYYSNLLNNYFKILIFDKLKLKKLGNFIIKTKNIYLINILQK